MKDKSHIFFQNSTWFSAFCEFLYLFSKNLYCLFKYESRILEVNAILVTDVNI